MKNILRLCASGLVAAFLALTAQAADLVPGAYSVGTVKGDVTYKLAGSSEYMPLTAGTALPQGVTIKTGADSSALIVFASGSVAAIDPGSEIEVTKFEQEVFAGPISADAEPSVSNTEIKVINGGVVNKVSKLKKGSNYTVNSPVGAAGVRGTTFRVAYDIATGAYSVEVVEGGVVQTIASGNTPVNAGQQLRSDGDGKWEVSDLPPAAAAKINAAIRQYLGDASPGGGRPGGTTDPVITVNVTELSVPVSPN